MRLLAAIVVSAACLVVAACGGGGGAGDTGNPTQNPLGPPDTADYFPLPANLRWLVSDNRLWRLMGPDPQAGAGAWRLRANHLAGGEPREETYRVTASSVVLVGARSSDPVNRAIGDVVLLRLPVRTGDSWVTHDAVLNNLLDVDRDGRLDRVTTRAVATVVGYEAVEVAAGRFDRALKVRMEERQTARLAAGGPEVSDTIVTERWYVAGIGAVLSISTQPSIGLELQRLELRGYKVGPLTTDAVAPTLRGSPPPAAPLNTLTLRFGFSEPMDAESTQVPLTVVGSNGAPVPGTLGWVTEARNELVFQLDGPVPKGTYRVVFSSQLTDHLGNALDPGPAWNVDFDFAAPLVLSTSPAAEAMEVPISTPLDLVLDEPADSVSVMLSAPWTTVSGTLTGSGRHWRFTPAAPLYRALRYEVAVSAADQAGNVMAALRYGFTTELGRFDPLASPDLARGNHHIATADVDGDGRADTVVLSYGNEYILLRQRADGSFEPRTIGAAARFDERFSLVDLDGDGRIDVVPSSSAAWWRQQADGGFERRALQDDGFILSNVQALRRPDGRFDLLGLLVGQPRVMRQTAPGVFAEAVDLNDVARGSPPTLGDVDGDGLVDIVTPGATADTAWLFIDYQRADGSFGGRQSVPLGAYPDDMPRFARVVDLDRDGRADLLVSQASVAPMSRVRVLRQTTAGVFAAPAGPDDGGQWLEAWDIDRDGRLDLVTAGGGFIVVHLQRPDGSFAPGEMYLDTRFSSPTGAQAAIALADFNGDGWGDVMAGGVLWQSRAATRPAAAPKARPAAGLRWLLLAP